MKKLIIIFIATVIISASVIFLIGNPFSQKTGDNQNLNALKNNAVSQIAFNGDKGENVVLKNNEILFDADIFSDGKAKFYNTAMPDGKIIYFFVVKDKNGAYHAAANACVVCFKTYKGFRQEGNEIVCNNCGNRYPIEKIATEKGGCNPGPINPNLPVKNGKIAITLPELEQVSGLF